MKACQSGAVNALQLFLRQASSPFETDWQDLLNTAVMFEQEVIIQSLCDWGVGYFDEEFEDTLVQRAPANPRIVRLLLKIGFPTPEGTLCGNGWDDSELDKYARDIVMEKRRKNFFEDFEAHQKKSLSEG
jgi:hypothetical protein